MAFAPPPPLKMLRLHPLTFIEATYSMATNPSFAHAVRFSPNGKELEIVDCAAFEAEVLPKFFKHNQLKSFVRQLNMHGFRSRSTRVRRSTEEETGGQHVRRTLTHPLFRLDAGLVWAQRIRRRPVPRKFDSKQEGKTRLREWEQRTRSLSHELEQSLLVVPPAVTVEEEQDCTSSSSLAAIDDDDDDDDECYHLLLSTFTDSTTFALPLSSPTMLPPLPPLSESFSNLSSRYPTPRLPSPPPPTL